MDLRKGIRQDNQAASRLTPNRSYGGFDFGFAMNRRHDNEANADRVGNNRKYNRDRPRLPL